jgi:predicted esterase
MTIRAHHLYVTRTARYCTLGEPGPSVRQLWLVCHGYGQLAADLLAGFGAAARPDRLIVAPEALSRFYTGAEDGPHGPDSKVGATWMTREDRLAEIYDYVAYLDRVHGHIRRQLPHHATVRTIALGFSQGTHTIARWAARTHIPIDELVLWGGTLPADLDPAEVAPLWGGAPRHARVRKPGPVRDRGPRPPGRGKAPRGGDPHARFELRGWSPARRCDAAADRAAVSSAFACFIG